MKLLIANPTYGSGGTVNYAAQAAVKNRHPDWDVHQAEISSSFLTWSFNQLWCIALNMRQIGAITHFLLLHADIRPRHEDWFDVLYGQMLEAHADVLSVIVPIKNADGLTSTAFDTDRWAPMRVTMTQAMAFEPTWSDPKLLFNTGCMLVDMREPWVEKVRFTINDKIERNAEGIWQAASEPEDWNFSRQCNRLCVCGHPTAWHIDHRCIPVTERCGCRRARHVRTAVTRAVVVDHYGMSHWPNDRAWGYAGDVANQVAPLAAR